MRVGRFADPGEDVPRSDLDYVYNNLIVICQCCFNAVSQRALQMGVKRRNTKGYAQARALPLAGELSAKLTERVSPVAANDLAAMRTPAKGGLGRRTAGCSSQFKGHHC